MTAVDGKSPLLREPRPRHKVHGRGIPRFHRPVSVVFPELPPPAERLRARYRGICRTQGKRGQARAHLPHRARDARNQPRDRLKGDLGSKPRGKTESRIKDEVVSSFNYGESRESLELAIAESHSKEGEVLAQLEEIKAVCQMAMNPAMRRAAVPTGRPSLARRRPNRRTRISARPHRRSEKHPALERLKEPVVELFRLYQNSYGMFALDWNRLQAGIQLMAKNTEAYFEAKEEDKDIRVQTRQAAPYREPDSIPRARRNNAGREGKTILTPSIPVACPTSSAEEKAAWASIAEDSAHQGARRSGNEHQTVTTSRHDLRPQACRAGV